MQSDLRLRIEYPMSGRTPCSAKRFVDLLGRKAHGRTIVAIVRGMRYAMRPIGVEEQDGIRLRDDRCVAAMPRKDAAARNDERRRWRGFLA